MPLEINKLEEILRLPKDAKIMAQKVSTLTSVGDNYVSLMLKVDITIETPFGTQKLYVVAKTVPPNEYTQKLFIFEETFRTEINFYKILVPLLQNFQKENGIEEVIDFFPKYYGSRLNLNNDESKVDTDCVLLLENLKMAEYFNIERTQGFDLDTTKVIVADLARLHAVTLALRLQNREVFEKEVAPWLRPWYMDVDFHNTSKLKLEKLVDSIPELKSLKTRICLGFDKKLQPSQIREPFATVIHNDCWVNNNMIKFDGTTIKNKMVDFQMCTFASPAKDLIFCLFSSVKSDVLEENYENLIRGYYDKFLATLKELGCDLSLFSFDGFLEELDFEAENSQFGHLMFMLYVIFCPRREVVELSAADVLDVVPTELHKKKMVFIVKEFAKRKWI